MRRSALKFGTQMPHHLAYLVDDVADAAQRWYIALGVGPFLTLPHMTFEELTVDGCSVRVRQESAYAAHGPMFVELQSISALDPPEALPRYQSLGGQGPHHMCYVVDDMVAESDRLHKAGAPCVIRGRGPGIDMAIHDGRGTVGFGIQVQQDNVLYTSFFGRVRAAAYDWDGRHLLRRFTF
ncbi:VOC family protein [Streptomyces sp. NBC_01497]|uniref:VOC family protein n=1 Tax=Streptomyces sp. NBC_01497 TaxID=2903885 RepID=UPI002E349979|nr:VOC family protein [Streptomyces sp. NBC_01497]